MMACPECDDTGYVRPNPTCRPDTWVVCECEAGQAEAEALQWAFENK